MTMRRRFMTGAVLVAALLAVVWFGLGRVQSQTSLSATTLSSAVTTTDGLTINLTSGSSVSSGDLLFVDREAMRVTAIVGNVASVARGVEGTQGMTHRILAKVWMGAPGRFYQNEPAGSCTAASELYAPRIVLPSGNVFDCTNGTWARRINGSEDSVGGNYAHTGEVTYQGRVFARESFDQTYFIMQDDATPKSLTDTEVNVVFGSPIGIITFREEQNKTVSSWVVDDGRLAIAGDDTTTLEGVEIVMGWTTTNEGWIVAGTSGACFTVNLTLTDISGTNELLIGWRQNEAFQDGAVYTGYSDWSLVGVNNVDGSIFGINEIQGGGTLSDDSGVNMADGETRTFKSCISATGVPTAFYTAASGTTFTQIALATGSGAKTAGDQMIPVIFFLTSGTDGPTPYINWMEVSAAP